MGVVVRYGLLIDVYAISSPNPIRACVRALARAASFPDSSALYPSASVPMRPPAWDQPVTERGQR
jgi:hypothetical protein